MQTGSAGRPKPPAEDDLIARLRRLPAGQPPDARFVTELRAQLVAIAPAEIGESAVRGPARRRWRARRPLLAVLGGALVLVVLLGLAVRLSNGALPGQSLYGIKRASENFQLSLAGSDADRGKAYLELATTRAEESQRLLGSTQSLNASQARLITRSLDSADADSRTGMQLLGRATVAQRSTQPLAILVGWVPAQQIRMATVARRTPAGSPTQLRAQTSLSLLDQVAARAAALRGKVGCSCLSVDRSDDLGPVPCVVCPPASTGPSTAAPSGPNTAGPSGSVGTSAVPTGSSGSVGPSAVMTSAVPTSAVPTGSLGSASPTG